uniref:Uncharacterized protein n=1 Tax=Anguilla anguilla TaxID=7936 RepID=A0A0E9WXH0_ANGAN
MCACVQFSYRQTEKASPKTWNLKMNFKTEQFAKKKCTKYDYRLHLLIILLILLSAVKTGLQEL